MTADSPDPVGTTPPGRRPTPEELERIFGTEQTSTSDDLPEPEVPRSDDDWFHRNRPPHHG